MSVFSFVDSTVTGPVAALAARHLRSLILLAIPILIAGPRVVQILGRSGWRGIPEDLWSLVLGVASLGIVLPLGVSQFRPLQPLVGPLLLVLVLGWLAAGVRVARTERAPAAWGIAAGGVAVAVLLAGALGGTVAANVVKPAAVETVGDVPQATFDATYTAVEDGDRGLLRITLERSADPLPRDALLLRGDGFASVLGANQTAPGPWNGTASSSTEIIGDRYTAVAPGDSVVVGVAGACRFDILYRSPVNATSTTLQSFECPGPTPQP